MTKDGGDREPCNISPLQVVNTLKRTDASKSRIASIRTRSDMCRNITQALDLKCLKGWHFKRFLGSGSHGSIFSVRNRKVVVRAAKIVTVDPGPELRAQKKMASIGVGPRVYDSCKISKGTWVMILEQVEGTLEDLVGGHKNIGKRRLADIFREIVLNVEAMEAANVSHGDLSLDNIGYVTRTDGSLRVMLIDFGWSGRHVPMFDMTSLAQSLLFTKNEANRDFLYEKTRAYISNKYDFDIPDSTDGFDDLFRRFQQRFVSKLRKPI